MENKKLETIVLGEGCFWCSEAVFSRLKGVEKVTSGYAGGHLADPTYEQVSAGGTGHAEVIKVDYDPEVINVNQLLDVFFGTHDPTTPNRQGSDIGEQYRSIILYSTEDQKKEAEKYIAKLAEDKIFEKPIVTQIKPLGEFYKAEGYHARYYEGHAEEPYCRVVISPKLVKLRAKFSSLMKE